MTTLWPVVNETGVPWEAFVSITAGGDQHFRARMGIGLINLGPMRHLFSSLKILPPSMGRYSNFTNRSKAKN